MATQYNNPYKKMKKALKGAKPSGDQLHKLAQKAVKKIETKKNKVAMPPKQDLGMAMKRKATRSEPTIGGKDIEHKKKGSIGMGGDKEMKSSKKHKGVVSLGDNKEMKMCAKCKKSHKKGMHAKKKSASK